jgi:hypothetical protein
MDSYNDDLGSGGIENSHVWSHLGLVHVQLEAVTEQPQAATGLVIVSYLRGFLFGTTVHTVVLLVKSHIVRDTD